MQAETAGLLLIASSGNVNEAIPNSESPTPAVNRQLLTLNSLSYHSPAFFIFRIFLLIMSRFSMLK